MLKKLPKRGDIVHVVFYDHADFEATELTGDPLRFEAFGRLVEESPLDYRIATWHTPSSVADPNGEYYSIIKGAIESIRVLK